MKSEDFLVSLTFLAVGGGQFVQIAVQETLICERKRADMVENSAGMEWSEEEWEEWNGIEWAGIGRMGWKVFYLNHFIFLLSPPFTPFGFEVLC